MKRILQTALAVGGLATGWCLCFGAPETTPGDKPTKPPAPRTNVPSTARTPQAVAADIDREITKALTDAKVPQSAPTDDAEFLRRVYVDITGRIPSIEQATAFLD